MLLNINVMNYIQKSLNAWGAGIHEIHISNFKFLTLQQFPLTVTYVTDSHA